MPSKNFRSKHHRKFRILLDSAFARKEKFSRLSKKANLLHPVVDLGMSPQTEDEELLNIAVREKRFVLTVNFEDFKRLLKNSKTGVFGIESELSNEEMDELVSDFLSGKNPEDFYGKATRIPNKG